MRFLVLAQWSVECSGTQCVLLCRWLLHFHELTYYTHTFSIPKGRTRNNVVLRVTFTQALWWQVTVPLPTGMPGHWPGGSSSKVASPFPFQSNVKRRIHGVKAKQRASQMICAFQSAKERGHLENLDVSGGIKMDRTEMYNEKYWDLSSHGDEDGGDWLLIFCAV
jgi:hypothetical protein